MLDIQLLVGSPRLVQRSKHARRVDVREGLLGSAHVQGAMERTCGGEEKKWKHETAKHLGHRILVTVQDVFTPLFSFIN